MKPRGALMIEHRLIEKVLSVLNTKTGNFDPDHYDPLFVETVIDFIKVYADRTHHGKEEDILFKLLKNKKMGGEDENLMLELIEDHGRARMRVKILGEYNKEFKNGHKDELSKITDILNWLVSFYPVHIKKEDAVFFPDTEKYFTQKELDKMLNDFWEFDRKMVHEKYQAVYQSLLKW